MGHSNTKPLPHSDCASVGELRKIQRNRVIERANLLGALGEVEKIEMSEMINPNSLCTTKVVVISDTHNKASSMEHSIPDGDILIHAGDFTNFSSDEEISQFISYLNTLPHKNKIIIGGNHDETVLSGAEGSNQASVAVCALLSGDHCIYLNNDTIEIGNIKIHGVSWVRGGFEKCQEAYKQIPNSVDILISHVPPLGYGDCMIAPTHCGDQDLLKIVQDVKPKFHVFGHAHEGHGIYKNENTIFINAAICSRDLSPVHHPILFDVSHCVEH